MPSTKKQPKLRPPKGTSTKRQPKASGKGSKGGAMTGALKRPKGY